MVTTATITDVERRLSYTGVPYLLLQLRTVLGENAWGVIAFHPNNQWYWERALRGLLNEYEWAALELSTRPLDPADRFFLAEELLPLLIDKDATVKITTGIFGHRVRTEVRFL